MSEKDLPELVEEITEIIIFYMECMHYDDDVEYSLLEEGKEKLEALLRDKSKPRLSRKWIEAIVIKEYYTKGIGTRTQGWIDAFVEAGWEVSDE